MKHARRAHPLAVVILAGVALTLNGCGFLFGQQGYFRDSAGDYADEKVSPELVIPGNIKAVEPVDLMVIPSVTSTAEVLRDDEVPRADRGFGHGDDLTYRVVTIAGGRKVLLVQGSSPKLWDQVISFWKANDIPLVSKDPSAHVLETDWVQLGEQSQPGLMRRLLGQIIDLENAEQTMEKFRLRVRPGAVPGTRQVLLEHARRGIDANRDAPVNWTGARQQATDASTKLQRSLLNRMVIYLAENRAEQGISLQASQTLDVGDQASLIRDGNGNPVLRINQDFARSWQAIDLALGKAGVRVIDRNRSAGVIFVSLPESHVEPESSKKSWFSWWGKEDSDSTPKREHRLRVQSYGASTSVTLEKDLNTLPPAELSEAFLGRLKDNLG